jgi:hypothetical protein
MNIIAVTPDNFPEWVDLALQLWPNGTDISQIMWLVWL